MNSTKVKLGDMFGPNFIPTGLTQQQQDARTDIYMQCRRIMKREIRGEEAKAREEEKKRQRKMSIKTAYVSKKNRKADDEEEAAVMSTSSAESRRFREQMKMPDLSGLPLRPSQSFVEDDGLPRTARIGGAISSIASEASDDRDFDQSVLKQSPSIDPKTRNREANRYSTTVRTKHEESTLEIIPDGRSGKEFLIIRHGQNPE